MLTSWNSTQCGDYLRSYSAIVLVTSGSVLKTPARMETECGIALMWTKLCSWTSTYTPQHALPPSPAPSILCMHTHTNTHTEKKFLELQTQSGAGCPAKLWNLHPSRFWKFRWTRKDISNLILLRGLPSFRRLGLLSTRGHIHPKFFYSSEREGMCWAVPKHDKTNAPEQKNKTPIFSCLSGLD